jgi:hypothetical protein
MEASLEVTEDEKQASIIAGIVINNILKSSYESAFLLDRGSRHMRDC